MKGNKVGKNKANLNIFKYYITAFIIVFAFVFYAILNNSNLQALHVHQSLSHAPSNNSTNNTMLNMPTSIVALNATMLANNITTPMTVYVAPNITLNDSLGTPVYQYDLNINHTYILHENVPPVNLNVGGAIIGTPTICKGLLIVTTMGNLTELEHQRYDLTTGSVVAIDMKSNKIVWKDVFPNQIMSQPITAGNVIIVAMGNNQEVPPKYFNLHNGIFGINVTNGKIIWNFTPSSSTMTTPALYKGNIYEVAMMGQVYVLNATTGKEVANFSIGLPDLLSSPLLNDNMLYFGGSYSILYPNGTRENHGQFFAINATTNNIAWATSFPNASAGFNDECAVFYKGMVISAYLANSAYTNPTLVAMNASTGKVIWELNETKAANEISISESNVSGTFLNFTENTVSPLVIWNGMVLSDSNFLGILFAVNITTGKPVWAVYTNQGEGPPNIVDNAYAVTLSDEGVLYVINATNGKIIKAVNLEIPHLTSQPVITNNYVIITGMNGEILSIPVNSLIS